MPPALSFSLPSDSSELRSACLSPDGASGAVKPPHCRRVHGQEPLPILRPRLFLLPPCLREISGENVPPGYCDGPHPSLWPAGSAPSRGSSAVSGIPSFPVRFPDLFPYCSSKYSGNLFPFYFRNLFPFYFRNISVFYSRFYFGYVSPFPAVFSMPEYVGYLSHGETASNRTKRIRKKVSRFSTVSVREIPENSVREIPEKFVGFPSGNPVMYFMENVSSGFPGWQGVKTAGVRHGKTEMS